MGLFRQFGIRECVLSSAGAAAGFVFYKWLCERSRRLTAKANEEKAYETAHLVNEYLLFHFGKDEEILPWEFGPKNALNFPKRCADLCITHAQKTIPLENQRVLDVGCAVGRSSFEMAAKFGEVIGMDFSQAFVNACNKLKIDRQMDYNYKLEGDLTLKATASVSHSMDMSRVSFQQGDANYIEPSLGQFDMVLAANLICRLSEPFLFFRRLRSLVKPGGIVVITSPYSWLDIYTDKENRIAGFLNPKDQTPVRGFEALVQIMEPQFKLVTSLDMPFFIREHVRKNQWSVANATVWQREQE